MWYHKMNFIFLSLIYFCFLLSMILIEWLSLIVPVNSLIDFQSTLRLQLYRLYYCLDHNCIVYIFYYFFIKELQIRTLNLSHSHIFVSKLSICSQYQIFKLNSILDILWWYTTINTYFLQTLFHLLELWPHSRQTAQHISWS